MRPATLIAYQPYECDRLDCKLANLTRYLHTWPLLHTGHASAVVAGRPWSNDQELAARRRPVSLVSDTQTRNDTPRSAGQGRRRMIYRTESRVLVRILDITKQHLLGKEESVCIFHLLTEFCKVLVDLSPEFISRRIHIRFIWVTREGILRSRMV